MLRFNTYLHYVGLFSGILLIIGCFLPWVHINSINETLTGFRVQRFPNGTFYGKAGNIILPLTVLITLFILVPKVWAKRANLFLASFLVAYSIRTYVIFTSSLFEGEVTKKIGIYLVAILPFLLLLSSIFPRGGSKIPDEIVQMRKEKESEAE